MDHVRMISLPTGNMRYVNVDVCSMTTKHKQKTNNMCLSLLGEGGT